MPPRPARRILPARVLQDVSWRFHGPRFRTRRAFDARVRRRQVDLMGKDHGWNPEAIVLRRSRIRVEYWGWDRSRPLEETRREIVLVSDSRRFFTAGELLLKLHNATTAELSRIDHQYFEGLVLLRSTATRRIPTYRLVQGS